MQVLLFKCKDKNYITYCPIGNINVNYNYKSRDTHHYKLHLIKEFLEVNKCVNANMF